MEGLKGANDDQTVGVAIARRCWKRLCARLWKMPVKKVLWLDKVKSGKGNHGYNASAGEYGDMIELGILDPTKVTRTALQAAASIAALAMITTEAMVSDLPDEGGAPAAPDMGAMGGMGGMGGMM